MGNTKPNQRIITQGMSVPDLYLIYNGTWMLL